MSDSYKDVIVIGAGIAGLTASKRLAQQRLSVQNIEAVVFGGLVLNINELDGKQTGSGAEFASNLLMEVTELGAECLSETVTGLSRAGGLVTVATDQGSHRAKAVVVASGARLKLLGVPGEAEFKDRGVAQCADCDGPMYQGQTVVVVGGGDSALQEALVLAHYAKEVCLVHRGASFRAAPRLRDAVAAQGNIKVRWNTVVEAITGGESVSGVRVRDTAGGTTTDIACSGVFAYVGLAPNSEFAPADMQRTPEGLITTDADLRTSMEGVWAIGAVRSGCGGQLEHAIADAERAASSVLVQVRSK